MAPRWELGIETVSEPFGHGVLAFVASGCGSGASEDHGDGPRLFAIGCKGMDWINLLTVLEWHL
jgi:hypothetical protein